MSVWLTDKAWLDLLNAEKARAEKAEAEHRKTTLFYNCGAEPPCEKCITCQWDDAREALAAARRECEARAIALRNIVGVWREVHDDAKHRRMWILGWETWLRVIAEGAALAAPAAGEPDPTCPDDFTELPK